jgi:hypothetical protein
MCFRSHSICAEQPIFANNLRLYIYSKLQRFLDSYDDSGPSAVPRRHNAPERFNPYTSRVQPTDRQLDSSITTLHSSLNLLNPRAVRIKGGPLSISSTYNSLTLCEDFVRIVLVGQFSEK